MFPCRGQEGRLCIIEAMSNNMKNHNNNNNNNNNNVIDIINCINSSIINTNQATSIINANTNNDMRDAVLWMALLAYRDLSNAASSVVCMFCRVKGKRNLNTCARRVVLDKWFPLMYVRMC